MTQNQPKKPVAILGTMDSKGPEHLFLKRLIESMGHKTITIDIGTTEVTSLTPDVSISGLIENKKTDRSRMIESIVEKAKGIVLDMFHKGEIGAIISAGGGTGTFMATSIMKVLPLGIPKFMLSTVASRDMSHVIGTKDITVMHSVVDLLGLNSISRLILERAAGAVCGMASYDSNHKNHLPRVALTLFGFITEAAENIKSILESNGYEVIPFHANGTGGMAMEEMAGEAFFEGILDLATHELVDDMFDGYCRGVGPQRLLNTDAANIPRLIIPGGLDSAVLEFDRRNIPVEYKDRKIFFYDFRSAIRLTPYESRLLAETIAQKLNQSKNPSKVLIPLKGWSEGDREGDVLFDPQSSEVFCETLEKSLNPAIEIIKVQHHINDKAFAMEAAGIMMSMIGNNSVLN
ncbi:MAG: Tm-1-like ATP-binding domain-containing protein [Desulfatiglandales bacterium]